VASVSATLANTKMAAALDCRRNGPLLRLDQTETSAHGDPVLLSREHYAPGVFNLTVPGSAAANRISLTRDPTAETSSRQRRAGGAARRSPRPSYGQDDRLAGRLKDDFTRNNCDQLDPELRAAGIRGCRAI
jgi:hypothetical protein